MRIKGHLASICNSRFLWDDWSGSSFWNGLSKSGAGLVTIGIPESFNDILQVKVTEAMTMPLLKPQLGVLV